MGESGGVVNVDLLLLLTVGLVHDDDNDKLLLLGAGLTGGVVNVDLLPLLTVGLVHDNDNDRLLLLGSESVDEDDDNDSSDIDPSEDNTGLSVGSILDTEVSIPNASCALLHTYWVHRS